MAESSSLTSTNTDVRKAVMREQQIQLVARLPLLSIANGSVALIAYFDLNTVFIQPVGLIWLCALLLASGLQIFSWLRLRHRDTPQTVSGSYLRKSFWVCAGVGLLWGLGFWIFGPDAGLEHKLLLAVMVAGVVAGTASLIPPFPRQIGVMALVALVPTFLGFLTHGGMVGWSMAGVTVVFCTTLILGSRQAYTSLSQLVEERRRAQASERAKAAFLANMSHEIRTPMNGVLGMTAALARSDLDRDQAHQVRIITEAGEALMTVLNDVLDLSKLEAGHMSLEERAYDVGTLVARVDALYRPRADEQGLKFTVEVEPSLADARMGDPHRVSQVLNNLVSNAIKFTENGRVEVRASAANDDPDRMIVTVRDTGVGMSKDQAAGVFSAFAQADDTVTRRFGGTGLGLTIVAQLVELMGGTIEVESVEGAGSCFTVCVPAPRVDDGDGTVVPLAPKPQPAAAPEGVRDDLDPDPDPDLDQGPVRVLAAEDNATNRMVLETLLAPLWIELTFAENGKRAVEAFSTEAFDLILMDIAMPEMDGIAAVRAIRALEADEGRDATPVVSLTANAMKHQVEQYREAGFDDHVSKPIRPDVLFEAITRNLKLTDAKERLQRPAV